MIHLSSHSLSSSSKLSLSWRLLLVLFCSSRSASASSNAFRRSSASLPSSRVFSVPDSVNPHWKPSERVLRMKPEQVHWFGFEFCSASVGFQWIIASELILYLKRFDSVLIFWCLALNSFIYCFATAILSYFLVFSFWAYIHLSNLLSKVLINL